MASIGLYSGPGVVGNPSLAGGLLLGFVLFGLAIFIWVFWSQRDKLKVFQKDISCSGQQGSRDGVQNIHKSLLALFLLDALHAITGFVLGIKFTAFPHDVSVGYTFVFDLWFLSRWFMQALHLLVALGSIVHLHLPMPVSTARMSRTAICMVAMFLAFVPLYVLGSRFTIFFLPFTIFTLAFTIIAKSAKSNATPSATARKKQFLFLSMFTFLVTFMPAFVLQCMVFFSALSPSATDDFLKAFTNTMFFTSVQLWADALLTYFVLKLRAEQEEPLWPPGLQVPAVAVNVIP